MKKLCILALLLFLTNALFSFSGQIDYTVAGNESEPSSWAVVHIEKAIDEKIVTERLLNNFQNNITREEFAEIIILLYERLSNNVPEVPSVNPFVDSDNESVLKANLLGIVGGKGNGTFAPNDLITRQEIAVMFDRMLTASNLRPIIAKQSVVFTDEKLIATWAKSSVQKLYKLGILGGVGANKINPLGNATREQAITLISRTFMEMKNINVSKFKIGDYIYYGKYNSEPILWQIISFDGDGNPLLFSNYGLSIKPFDAPSNSNNGQAIMHGSNEWEFSTIRKWLNSNDVQVQWGDKTPNLSVFKDARLAYDREPGFLSSSNFTQKEYSGIKVVENKVLLNEEVISKSTMGYQIHIESDDYKNLVQNYDNAYALTTLDRVFLLSIKEVTDYVLNKGFVSSSNLSPTAKKLFPDGAKGFWLRDASIGSVHVVRMIYDNKRATMEGASVGYVAIRPAIYFNYDKMMYLDGTGTLSNPYRISFE